MKIIQWILCAFCALFGAFFAANAHFISLALILVSLVLLLPPIQPKIAEKVFIFKSKVFNIFLSIVLVFISLGIAGSSIVSLSNVAVCSSLTDGICAENEIAFLEGTRDLFISATVPQENGPKEVELRLDYWPNPDQGSNIFNDVLAVPETEDFVIFTIKEVPLQAGSYRITTIPVGMEEDQSGANDSRDFTVWTDEADVVGRNNREVDDAGLHNSISSLKICPPNDQEYCTQDFNQFPVSTASLYLTAEIPGLKLRTARTRGDSEITFILRNPEISLRETTELDRDVATYTLEIGAPPEGFPPGQMEVISALETRSSKPIRKIITFQ